MAIEAEPTQPFDCQSNLPKPHAHQRPRSPAHLLLSQAHDRERSYVQAVMPAKLQVALEGVQHSSVVYDLGSLLRTALAVVWPGALEHPALRQSAQAIDRLNHEPSK